MSCEVFSTFLADDFTGRSAVANFSKVYAFRLQNKAFFKGI